MRGRGCSATNQQPLLSITTHFHPNRVPSVAMFIYPPHLLCIQGVPQAPPPHPYTPCGIYYTRSRRHVHGDANLFVFNPVFKLDKSGLGNEWQDEVFGLSFVAHGKYVYVPRYCQQFSQISQCKLHICYVSNGQKLD